MARHKWADLFGSWLNDTSLKIEVSYNGGESWSEFEPLMQKWMEHFQYRIKPTPKPDAIRSYWFNGIALVECIGGCHDDNLRLTFDGETGQLKSAEVLK